MATGVRPFRGDSQAQLISAILRDPPRSVTDLVDHLPAQLDRILEPYGGLGAYGRDDQFSYTVLRDELNSNRTMIG